MINPNLLRLYHCAIVFSGFASNSNRTPFTNSNAPDPFAVIMFLSQTARFMSYFIVGIYFILSQCSSLIISKCSESVHHVALKPFGSDQARRRFNNYTVRLSVVYLMFWCLVLTLYLCPHTGTKLCSILNTLILSYFSLADKQLVCYDKIIK